MTEFVLETPDSADSLYMARGEDVDELRPPFTGDIYASDEETLMLVQHPCALRKGVVLHETLLAVTVRSRTEKPRKEWRKHAVTEMPLPGLREGHAVADFLGVTTVKSASLEDRRRLAMLSERGVNLLMQRWVYHCTRVIIPTITYNDQTFGPFNEAELAVDWLEQRQEVIGREAALREFEEWMRGSTTAGQPTRQQRLADRQEANTVRKETRAQLKAI
ncbi:hypothetical protein ACWEK5_40470 [Rhodococcus koreensis]